MHVGHTSWIPGLAGVALLAALSPVSAALLPVSGNGYTQWNSAQLLDHQPIEADNDPTNETPAQSGRGSNIDAFNEGWNWFDFGPDWASITITAAFSHYNEYAGPGNSNANGFAGYMWANGTDTSLAAQASWTAATDFMLAETTPTGDASYANNWHLSWSGSTTLGGRYLMLNSGPAGSRVTTRLAEVAFYGTVPEPATLGLVATGVALTLGRRRQA